MRALILHGGFTENPTAFRDRLERQREGLLLALQGAWEKDSALAMAVEAVRLLEDDPRFNAGTGSKLQSDGVARMSAALMDGDRRRFSGVINIERVQNPILVAQRLQGETFTVLGGPGATAWARAQGFPDYAPERNVPRLDKSGTVGACALLEGKLAAATSTGGRGQETIGRVSDSATVAGNYATDRAAVSCTGLGEEIVDEALAVCLAGQDFDRVFEDCRARDRHFGAIGVDRAGKYQLGECQGLLFWAAMVDGRPRSFGERL